MAEHDSILRMEGGPKKPSIKTPDRLAKQLGFVQSRSVKEWGYREFLKELPGGRSVALAFQNGKYGGQRITLGIKPEPPDDKAIDEVNFCQGKFYDEEIRPLGLSLNDAKMFVRDELNNGGYQKL